MKLLVGIFERTTHNNEMHRLTSEDYAVDAVTVAKAHVGAWLCRRLDDGSVVRWQKGSATVIFR